MGTNPITELTRGAAGKSGLENLTSREVNMEGGETERASGKGNDQETTFPYNVHGKTTSIALSA